MKLFSFGVDGIINLWQVLVFLVCAGLAFAFIPWLMKLQFRLAGKRPPHFSTTVGRCLACCGATVAIAFGVFMLCMAIVEPLLRKVNVCGDEKVWMLVCMALVVVLSVLANYRILRAETLCGDVLTKAFVIKCAAAVLILTLAGWAPCLHALGRIRLAGKIAATASNLASVSKGLGLYQNTYKCFPEDIRYLCDVGYATVHALYSPLSPKDCPGTITTQPYRGPIGFNYIPLTGDAPDDLILLWDDPGNCVGGYSCVLYKNGQVKTLAPAELSRELSRAYEWLISRRSAASQSAILPENKGN